MTSTKTVLATILLVTLPTLASAGCQYGDQKHATMSCADGATWNPETKSCIKSTS